MSSNTIDLPAITTPRGKKPPAPRKFRINRSADTIQKQIYDLVSLYNEITAKAEQTVGRAPDSMVLIHSHKKTPKKCTRW